MVHHELSTLLTVVLASGLVAGSIAAIPPGVDDEENGLTDNETALLWSHDQDSGTRNSQNPAASDRSAVQQLANGTDATFKRPPDTAATWTRNDFRDLAAGGTSSSVHPRHATLEDGRFIKDGHATVFAVHPSTRGHIAPDNKPLYVAPSGAVRGFVDYRVHVPEGDPHGNITTEWELSNHEVESVRLQSDDETIARTSGSHTPVLDYQLEDRSPTLTFEATISVTLTRITRIDRENETEVRQTERTETLTVSDSIPVETYDLHAYPYSVTYPSGDTGVAIFQPRPWQGYSLTDSGNSRVRGVWRFYTARDRSWDILAWSTATDTTTTASDALPVYVHAYPSQIGPRTEPVRNGPDIIDTWGFERSTPAEQLGEHINVDVVDQSYTTTYGVAVRADAVNREGLEVNGIVRGVNADIVDLNPNSERHLRRSNLSLERINHNNSAATLRITLRDNRTGDPIDLQSDSRRSILGDSVTRGYITVADQRVETNESGIAVVTVEQPGLVTAHYQPGSWLSQDPAYTGDTATVRWHPLGTIGGWFSLLVALGWRLLPFFVALYAGRQLLQLLGYTPQFNHKR